MIVANHYRTIKDTMTEKRRAWLKQLGEDGYGRRPPNSKVGYDCMQLGWTEWRYIDRDTGEVLRFAEAKRRFPDAIIHDIYKNDGTEMLTELGRRMLEDNLVGHKKNGFK